MRGEVIASLVKARERIQPPRRTSILAESSSSSLSIASMLSSAFPRSGGMQVYDLKAAMLVQDSGLEVSADLNSCLNIARKAGYTLPAPTRIETYIPTHQGVVAATEKKKTTPGAKQ
ncbi:MAG: hypothetical protein ACP5GL_00835 [Infirmifilum sp.]